MSTIVCLGDSITGVPDLASYLKWPHILELMCEARCGAGRWRVVNRGIGGDTSAGMRARLPRDVLAEAPAVVVLLAGGNDACQGVPRDTTAANLSAIAVAVAGSGARLLGLQYHLVPHPGRESEAWHRLPANNDLLVQAVTAVGGAIADTAAAIAGSGLAPAELTGPDAVHLNPGGELVYARAVFAALAGRGWI